MFIDSISTVTIGEQNTFVRNQAYVQASGVFIRNAVQVNIEDSSFSGNNGFYQTRGIAVVVSHSNFVTVNNSDFNNNLGGQKGSAIYLSFVSNANLVNNKFVNHGPILSFSENNYSPYYKFLLASSRSAVYYNPTQNCTDEFAYISSCIATGFKV